MRRNTEGYPRGELWRFEFQVFRIHDIWNIYTCVAFSCVESKLNWVATEVDCQSYIRRLNDKRWRWSASKYTPINSKWSRQRWWSQRLHDNIYIQYNDDDDHWVCVLHELNIMQIRKFRFMFIIMMMIIIIILNVHRRRWSRSSDWNTHRRRTKYMRSAIATTRRLDSNKPYGN